MNKKEKLILLSFILIIILSRLAYHSKYLYEWDSVQYALSINEFNILWHQPHPPGYILYVFLLKFFHLFIHTDNSTIIFVNICLSGLTVFLFHLLIRMFFSDYSSRYWSTILFILNPVFWFYGITATIYVVETFVSILVGYLLLKILISPSYNQVLFASFIIGLLGGFRQSAIILLLPLVLYVFIATIKELNKWPKIIVAFFLGTLIWYIPTLVNTRGISNYNLSTSGLLGDSSVKIELFFGNIYNYLSTNLSNLFVWLLQSVSPVGFVVLIFSLILIIKKQNLISLSKTRKFIFLILWILPNLIFSLSYIEKAGYLLSIIPPLMIAITWSTNNTQVKELFHQKPAQFQSGIFIFISLMFVTWFTITPNHNSGKKIMVPSSIIIPPLSDYNWDISYREINQKDLTIDSLISYMDKKYDNPNELLLMYGGGYPTWRHIMYYLPDYGTYWLIDETISGNPSFSSEFYYAKNMQVTSYSGCPFWTCKSESGEAEIVISPEVNHIVWIVSPKSSFYEALHNSNIIVESFILPNHQEVIVSSTQLENLFLEGFSFVK